MRREDIPVRPLSSSAEFNTIANIHDLHSPGQKKVVLIYEVIENSTKCEKKIQSVRDAKSKVTSKVMEAVTRRDDDDLLELKKRVVW